MNIEDAILLLTRPVAGSDRFADQVVQSLGAPGRIVISPVLQIGYFGGLPELPEVFAAAFTSAEGVAAFVRFSGWRGRAYCVGPRTGAVAREAGFDVVAGSGGAAELAEVILAQPPGCEVVHFAGQYHRGNLVEGLQARGQSARRVILYHQHEVPLSAEAVQALAAPGLVLLPIFSPRSARILSAQIGNSAKNLCICALSPAVAADCAFGNGVDLTVASEPTAKGMVDALSQSLRAA
ncbi:uroporphyrinogen-III synthase [Alphaproteobacteria bacterium KMM 3653]|uniref:Uroporphyrinogen-III synthase n=1 Tax=Harenicola maris TaxID=2841044 RepID=A0AAP2CQF9_9RHOB|nr:uroporphyrinogen-III synthase [Harenicola maris]